MRRTLAAANLSLVLLLLAVLFILVNYVSSRRFGRWDLSREQVTALSDQTRQILGQLHQPVEFIVFYQPDHRLYTLITDLLTEYQRASGEIRVEHVDPLQDVARAQQLVSEFQVETENLVIVRSGDRHKHLSDTDLAEFDYGAQTLEGEPHVKLFKAEAAFTGALLNLTQDETPLMWFTTGHGEKALDAPDPTGYTDVKRYLEQQNLRLETVTLLDKTAIPSDVRAVVIAGPTHRFTEPEVTLLEQYLAGGGATLALLDPLTDTGLDALLERWGLRVGQDIVVDPARQLPFVSAANLFVTTYTDHAVVRKMKTLMTLFPLARSVQPGAEAPADLEVQALALTSPQGWGETTTGVETFSFDTAADLAGPVTIAAAAQRRQPADESQPAEGRPARLVAVGDSDFAVNAQLHNVGNRDFLLGALHWLTAQEHLIGIAPKPIENLKVSLTAAQLGRIQLATFLGMPLLLGAAGTAVWWRRRT